jgi:hypothetical protein
MIAATGGTEILIGVAYTVGAALVLAMARAAMQTRSKMQDDKRDAASTYERLYGKPANPRTNEPATKGWTDHVDETLESQNKMLLATSNEVHGLRGDLHRFGQMIVDNTNVAANKILGHADVAAKAAATEVLDQIEERGRVQKRDAAADEKKT